MPNNQILQQLVQEDIERFFKWLVIRGFFFLAGIAFGYWWAYRAFTG